MLSHLSHDQVITCLPIKDVKYKLTGNVYPNIIILALHNFIDIILYEKKNSSTMGGYICIMTIKSTYWYKIILHVSAIVFMNLKKSIKILWHIQCCIMYYLLNNFMIMFNNLYGTKPKFQIIRFILGSL